MNEDEFYKRLAQAKGERDQAMRDYLEACQVRDEAQQTLSEVAEAVGGVLSVDDLVSEVKQLAKDRAFLKNHYSMEAAAMLRAELASARGELRSARVEWQRDLDGCNTIIDQLKARLGER